MVQTVTPTTCFSVCLSPLVPSALTLLFTWNRVQLGVGSVSRPHGAQAAHRRVAGVGVGAQPG